ncbi:putative pyridoxal phosphate-dependent acyltransferase [bacterium BMS3Bbin03]|nr:putative pyridoxal phosphate-dependent acyltransferase [bacterium BMS3Bbin03]
MGKLDFIRQDLDAVRKAGTFITIRTIGSPQGAWIVVDGKKVLNLCSNNYLGFANDSRLKRAAQKAIDEYGVGPAAVRTIAGTMALHTTLEEKLAKFKNVEAAISFQSGFNTNLAAIPALVGKDDLIFSDELNHASIIDGCRLSRGKVVRYEHCRPESLKAQLEAYKDHPGKKLLVTDGVFSMDGDIAPLDKLLEVAEPYGVITMVDDAHGEGVLGNAGRGIADHYGLHGKLDIEVGTMSKAFGVVGGYVAGKKLIVDYLHQKARPFLFSSAVTPPDVAACIAAVDILQKSGELVEKLWDNAGYFKRKMEAYGFDLGFSQTPITPVMIGDEKTASELSRRLFEEDSIFAQSIAFPTVPKGKARIRVMISAGHSKEDLDYGAAKFAEAGKALGVI